jgi:hypothetical protein
MLMMVAGGSASVYVCVQVCRVGQSLLQFVYKGSAFTRVGAPRGGAGRGRAGGD